LRILRIALAQRIKVASYLSRELEQQRLLPVRPFLRLRHHFMDFLLTYILTVIIYKPSISSSSCFICAQVRPEGPLMKSAPGLTASFCLQRSHVHFPHSEIRALQCPAQPKGSRSQFCSFLGFSEYA